jgi:hypothetical protein
MTREGAIGNLMHAIIWNDMPSKEALEMAIKALEHPEQNVIAVVPCGDAISRKSIKQKLQERHDFFVNAYGEFSNLPQYDKSRVDEITNCIAMVVNEPSIQPEVGHWIPVSERMPKPGEYVGGVARYYLVQNEYGDMLVARYTHGEYWKQIYQLKSIGDEIVAWMPLPKQYEPQERSGEE